MRKKNITPYILGIVLIIFASSIIIVTSGWMESSFEFGYGAGFYPKLLAIVLIVLAVLLFFETWAEKRGKRKGSKPSNVIKDSQLEGKESVDKEEDAPEEESESFFSRLKHPAIFFGMMILYAALFNILGFIVDTIIFLLAGMLILKGKLLNSIIITVLFTVAVYFLFGYLLRVQLPIGIIFGG